MNKINADMKAFITLYMQMAKDNETKKEELKEKLDNLTTEIDEIYQADREADARRIETMRTNFGLTVEPEPVKDPRYAPKMRQKEALQEQYDELVKESERELRVAASEQKSELKKELEKKEKDLKDLETKYLVNAKETLQIEEQKLALIAIKGTEEQKRLVEAERDVAQQAIDTIKSKSDELLQEVDHLHYFLQTISDLEQGKYDLKKLEKSITKLDKADSLEDAKKLMQGAKVPEKAKESEPSKDGEGTPGTPTPGTPTPGTPTPGTPTPGTPTPGTPTPGTPTPGTPTLGTPTPGTPTPGTGEPTKPEGAITAIRYSAVDNTYELTYENGAKDTCTPEAKSLREFKKEDKRYLKELIPGFGAYKRCDMGLFKALRDIDREKGTHHFEEYIKLLNGEESAIESITYDAEKMNDPAAFQKQEPETRKVMTRMMRKVRGIEGISVVGYKPTRFQRFVDFFTGRSEPKQIEEPKAPKVEVHDDPITPAEVEVHPMVEVHEEELQKPKVEEHSMTEEEAKRVQETFGGRRTQRGKAWADSLKIEGEPAEEKKTYTVDEIIAEVKSWNEEHSEEHGDEEK